MPQDRRRRQLIVSLKPSPSLRQTGMPILTSCDGVGWRNRQSEAGVRRSVRFPLQVCDSMSQTLKLMAEPVDPS
jgi:hypothetical protein